MSRLSQLTRIKKHLEASRKKLLEKAASYKYIDEVKSDTAAFKAMKISKKLNQMSFLEA